MKPPFEIGDKVMCIKNGPWRFNAGLGKKATKNTPKYGEICTVEYIDVIVSEPNEDNNGVIWGMILEEYPHIENGNPEDSNIYSCRRFERVCSMINKNIGNCND